MKILKFILAILVSPIVIPFLLVANTVTFIVETFMDRDYDYWWRFTKGSFSWYLFK